MYSAHFPSPSFIVSEVLSHRHLKSLILATLKPSGGPSGHSQVNPSMSLHLQQRFLEESSFHQTLGVKPFSLKKLSPIIAKFLTPSFWPGKLALLPIPHPIIDCIHKVLDSLLTFHLQPGLSGHRGPVHQKRPGPPFFRRGCYYVIRSCIRIIAEYYSSWYSVIFNFL